MKENKGDTNERIPHVLLKQNIQPDFSHQLRGFSNTATVNHVHISSPFEDHQTLLFPITGRQEQKPEAGYCWYNTQLGIVHSSECTFHKTYMGPGNFNAKFIF